MPSKREGTCVDCAQHGVLAARGLCGRCYQRRWIKGQEMPPLLSPTFEEQFAQASEGRSDSECWPWPGPVTPATGYPTTAAYRKVWVMFNGPIPRRNGKTLNVDHRCHSESDCRLGAACPHRRCVNPKHLRLLTWEDNILLANRPLCMRGRHQNAERSDDGQAGCPECRAEYGARYRAKHRAELNRAQRERTARKRSEAAK